MACASENDDLPEIISLDSDDLNEMNDLTLLEQWSNSNSEDGKKARKESNVLARNNQHGQYVKIWRDSLQNSGNSYDTFSPDTLECDICRLLEIDTDLFESFQFWRSVETNFNTETNCHVKYYRYFLMKLKDIFPDERGLKNRKIINMLRMLLQVQGTDETGTLSLENFVHTVKCFGPVKSKDGRCCLIEELEMLCRGSRQIDLTKNENKSWFAGFMTNKDSELILSSQEDSTFLIRISRNTEPGEFVLSTKHNGTIYHFDIKRKEVPDIQSEYTWRPLVFNGKTYRNLPELVDDIKYTCIRPEDEADTEVKCKIICPGLPLNNIISGYRKTKPN